jgi:hypothetical protein
MFDTRRAIVALGLIAFVARTSAAQDLNKIGARLLAADRAFTAGHDSIQALAKRERAKELPYDSIVAGSLTLRYRSKDFSRATQTTLTRAANESWKQMQRGLGDGADRIVRRVPVIVDERSWQNQLLPHIIDFHLPSVLGRSYSFTIQMSDEQAAGAIVDLIGSAASLDEPLTLQHYAGAWIPVGGIGARSWDRAAIDLATSNSAATRDCFAGAIPRCKSALGLTEIADPLTEWYSPADWRVMVSGMHRPPGETTGRQASIDACLNDNIAKECEMLVRERAIPRPLDMESRHTLIGLALELGGPKAFDRMTAATGSADDVLAATSGLGIDELISRWRMRILTTTPENVRPRALEATTMIAWILIFAFVAQRKRP